jgi:hypothetical protein
MQNKLYDERAAALAQATGKSIHEMEDEAWRSTKYDPRVENPFQAYISDGVAQLRAEGLAGDNPALFTNDEKDKVLNDRYSQHEEKLRQSQIGRGQISSAAIMLGAGVGVSMSNPLDLALGAATGYSVSAARLGVMAQRAARVAQVVGDVRKGRMSVEAGRKVAAAHYLKEINLRHQSLQQKVFNSVIDGAAAGMLDEGIRVIGRSAWMEEMGREYTFGDKVMDIALAGITDMPLAATGSAFKYYTARAGLARKLGIGPDGKSDDPEINKILNSALGSMPKEIAQDLAELYSQLHVPDPTNPKEARVPRNEQERQAVADRLAKETVTPEPKQPETTIQPVDLSDFTPQRIVNDPDSFVEALAFNQLLSDSLADPASKKELTQAIERAYRDSLASSEPKVLQSVDLETDAGKAKAKTWQAGVERLSKQGQAILQDYRNRAQAIADEINAKMAEYADKGETRGVKITPRIKHLDEVLGSLTGEGTKAKGLGKTPYTVSFTKKGDTTPVSADTILAALDRYEIGLGNILEVLQEAAVTGQVRDNVGNQLMRLGMPDQPPAELKALEQEALRLYEEKQKAVPQGRSEAARKEYLKKLHDERQAVLLGHKEAHNPESMDLETMLDDDTPTDLPHEVNIDGMVAEMVRTETAEPLAATPEVELEQQKAAKRTEDIAESWTTILESQAQVSKEVDAILSSDAEVPKQLKAIAQRVREQLDAEDTAAGEFLDAMNGCAR